MRGEVDISCQIDPWVLLFERGELFVVKTRPQGTDGKSTARGAQLTDAGGRRYAFRATRPNATYAGILDCDEAGSLSVLQIISAPSELGNQVTEEPPTLEGAGNIVVVRRIG